MSAGSPGGLLARAVVTVPMSCEMPMLPQDGPVGGGGG